MLTPNFILQNRYRVIRELGHGGMGTVYEAVDQSVNCIVALKEMLAPRDGEARKAFEREAALLANLRHQALPKVMHCFTEDEGTFLVMEFIPGYDLKELLASRGSPFPQAQVLGWADELLKLLAYLHTHQPPILHRDIKPANLKLTDQDEIFLLDFGLAKGSTGQMPTLVTSRSIFGYTPSYAPLEQILGKRTEPRSDLYSLGATLYHLLAGVPPTDAPTRFHAIEDDKPDPLQPLERVNPLCSPSVAAIIHLAMSINRKNRPGSAAEMRTALRKVVEEVEATRRQAEHEQMRLAEEVRERADAERRQAAEEARARAERAIQLQAEIAALRKAEEAHRRQIEEIEMRRHAEAEKLEREEEALRQAALDLERHHAEAEATRKRAEEESRRTAKQQRLRAEEEVRLQAEDEVVRRAEEERQRLEEEARRQYEEQEHQLSVLEAIRAKAEEEAQARAERERQVRAEIDALRKTEQEQRQKIEEAEQRRRAKGAKLQREDEALGQKALAVEQHRAETQAASRKAEEDAAGVNHEGRRTEEEVRRRADEDERKHAELQMLRRKVEEEMRTRAEQERRIRAEINELNRASEEHHRRLETELRTEAEGRLRQEKQRHASEKQERDRRAMEIVRTEVRMPQLGESKGDGTITKWHKNVGDRVARDEPLFDVCTEKVDAEIPSPASGVLIEIRFKEGDGVDVNSVVAVLSRDRAN
jgi:biotin carboxyl carrier protein